MPPSPAYSSREHSLRKAGDVMYKTSELDFVYGSTLVSSAGGKGTENERISRLLDCRTAEAVLDAVCDSGIAPDFERRANDSYSTTDALSDALTSALDHAVSVVRAAAPVEGYYDMFFYKYDCNNVKAAIKASVRRDAPGGCYFNCGTVSPETIRHAVETRDFGCLPHHMSSAAANALETYERTCEARCIDFIIDRAYFEDISDAADRSDVPFFSEYVSAVADVTNIRTSCRISRANLTAAASASLFRRVFVPGGTVACEVFTERHDGGVPGLSGIADALPLSPLQAAVKNAAEANDPELLDAYVAGTAKAVSGAAFSPEKPAVFLLMREEEIRRYRRAAVLISGCDFDRLKSRLEVKLYG